MFGVCMRRGCVKVFDMMIESYVQCVFWACVRWGVECGGRTVCVWGEKKLRGQGWHGRPLPRFICIFRNSLSSSHQHCSSSTGRSFHESGSAMHIPKRI